MELPSRLLEAAVDRIASLPGIGRKTALRLALHLLRSDAERVHGLARALTDMRDGVRPCRVCHTATEGAECSVCADPARPEHLICLVEDLRDQLAIEALGSFRGRYHVLGGLISPMDGVGPADLHVTSLEERLRALPEGTEVEVIFALPATMEGETTAYYVYRRIAPFVHQVTVLARGVAVGDDLQHADEATLAQSLRARIPYRP